MDDKIDRQIVLQGQSLARINQRRKETGQLQSLNDFEFRVFSQFGEDGILQHLIQEAGIEEGEKTFVEFGVQDYQESNTRFLLQGYNWKGLIIDGNEEWVNAVRGSSLCWRYNLKAVAAWIDCDNINSLILSSGIAGKIGILSIDIDGNDYWVWESINQIKPIIVICEWNSSYGDQHSVSIPYQADFHRASAHYSQQYWGASIEALNSLGLRKGYRLVGSNLAGNNLFFVRSERMGSLTEKSSREAWVEAKFSDTRDRQGNLTFLRGRDRQALIEDLPLVNIADGGLTCLRELGY